MASPVTSTRKVFNFSAGPAVLPEDVLRKAAAEMLDYHGCGMGVMEMSHRGVVYEGIIAKAEADLRKILNVPANYKILFVEGGATHQFSSIPLNLLGGEKKEADYIVTGTWSKKAAAEAKRYGKVNIVCDAGKYTHIPDQKEWKPFSPNAAYAYYTDNETIEGLEFQHVPEVPAGLPLVCDMSSNFLSRRFDVSKFGMVYACAQKNFGPAGLTIIIIREDLLNIPPMPMCPTIFMNKLQADNKSMYNTPAAYNIYVAGLVFEWIEQIGGLAKLEEINAEKVARLYKYIDESGYYHNAVPLNNRSHMNVPFLGANADLEKTFLKEAEKAGLMFLAGHRSVGGFRASLYNSMPSQGVDALIAFMKDFAAKNPKKQ